MLKIFSKLNCLAILKYHNEIKKKTIFLVNLHHLLEHNKARKDEKPI